MNKARASLAKEKEVEQHLHYEAFVGSNITNVKFGTTRGTSSQHSTFLDLSFIHSIDPSNPRS